MNLDSERLIMAADESVVAKTRQVRKRVISRVHPRKRGGVIMVTVAIVLEVKLEKKLISTSLRTHLINIRPDPEQDRRDSVSTRN